jgi:anti-anti-sigma factor
MSQSPEIVIETTEGLILCTIECTQMDDEHAKTMLTEVSKAAEQTPVLPVVLDMSKVEILLSISIGVLVALLQQFKAEGRRFMLAGLQPRVRETLAICRLDKLFDICDSVDDARSRLGPAS